MCILTVIFVCHIAIILFVVLTPFIGNYFFLAIHAIIVPFIMLHWICNNNMCALTLLEQNIQGKNNWRTSRFKRMFYGKINRTNI